MDVASQWRTEANERPPHLRGHRSLRTLLRRLGTSRRARPASLPADQHSQPVRARSAGAMRNFGSLGEPLDECARSTLSLVQPRLTDDDRNRGGRPRALNRQAARRRGAGHEKEIEVREGPRAPARDERSPPVTRKPFLQRDPQLKGEPARDGRVDEVVMKRSKLDDVTRGTEHERRQVVAIVDRRSPHGDCGAPNAVRRRGRTPYVTRPTTNRPLRACFGVPTQVKCPRGSNCHSSNDGNRPCTGSHDMDLRNIAAARPTANAGYAADGAHLC